MKKLILLSLLLVGMVSCSKQDTAEPEMPQPTVESSTTANPPTGTLRLSTTQITVTDGAPGTFYVELWDGGAWVGGGKIVGPHTITPEGLYDVYRDLWAHDATFVVSKIPGSSGGKAYLSVYNQRYLDDPNSLELIGTVTIN